MASWQTQEAKSKFSELVKMAAQSPQFVTIHGKPSVVIISQAEYARLSKPKLSFIEMMRASLSGDLNIERDRSLPREVDL